MNKKIMSNYRKSSGRFGEIDDESGVERPPLRRSVALPNARANLEDFPIVNNNNMTCRVLDNIPLIRTEESYLTSVEPDDMSSLGDDPSVIDVALQTTTMRVVLLPRCEISKPPIPESEQHNLTESTGNRTSQTMMESSMTIFMDLFRPLEASTKDFQSQSNVIEDESNNHQPKKDISKKKKPSQERVTKATTPESEVTNEKSKRKKKSTKTKGNINGLGDGTMDSVEQNHSTKSRKGAVTDEDPSSSSGVSSKRAQKKSRKSNATAKIGPKKKEVESCDPKASSKVDPKMNVSKTKQKSGLKHKNDKKSRDMLGLSLFATDNGDQVFGDLACRPHSPIHQSNYWSIVSTEDEPALKSVSEQSFDYFFEDSSPLSCTLSTNPDKEMLLPDVRNVSSSSCDDDSVIGSKCRTLELAIASTPKPRIKGKEMKISRKTHGRLLQKIFGDGKGSHSQR